MSLASSAHDGDELADTSRVAAKLYVEAETDANVEARTDELMGVPPPSKP